MKSVISLPEFDLIVHPITEADQGLVKVIDKRKPRSGPVYCVLADERKLYQADPNAVDYDYRDRIVEKEFTLDLKDIEHLPFSKRIISNRRGVAFDTVPSRRG